MTAKQYCRIFGAVLIVVGIVGFIIPGIGSVISFHAHHNLVHLLSGGVLLYFGIRGIAGTQRLVCQLFGIAYGFLTLWGFLGNADLGFITLHLNTAYNIVHLVVSGLALWAGFSKRPSTAAA